MTSETQPEQRKPRSALLPATARPWSPGRAVCYSQTMKRRTVYFRRDTELSEFANRRGIDYSSAVNLLLGLALDNHVPHLENPNQLVIPGFDPTEKAGK